MKNGELAHLADSSCVSHLSPVILSFPEHLIWAVQKGHEQLCRLYTVVFVFLQLHSVLQ